MTVNKKTVSTFIVFLILSLVAYWGTACYRPYIYANKIYDHHLADVFPSLFCVPVGFTFMSFIYMLRGKMVDRKYLYILVTALAFFIYEFLNFCVGGAFDWRDCVAIVIGTSVTLIAQLLIEIYCRKCSHNSQSGLSQA